MLSCLVLFAPQTHNLLPAQVEMLPLNASKKGTVLTSTPQENFAQGKNVTSNIHVLPVMDLTPNLNMGRTQKISKTNLPSPIQVKALSELLTGYSDKAYLIKGFTEGFLIDFEGEDTPLHASNAQTANLNPEAVNIKINKELALGRVRGPFLNPPFNNFKVSPLALREKQGSGKFRLLHNLSYPYDFRSVNSNISKNSSTVQYQTITDAIHLIQQLTPKPYLAKSDISEAFRLIPIHPSQYHLLGFKWQGFYYYDCCLPMGCASSCKIFERFSDALQWILKNTYHIDQVVKVLDDFLFVEKDEQACQNSLEVFKRLCARLHVPLALHKTEGPSTKITFLGIGLDTSAMQAFLPELKLKQYKLDITEVQSKKKIKLRELKSLLGKLQFATAVVMPGRPFLRRLYDLTIGVKKPFHYIRLNKDVKHDLLMWESFLLCYNGVTIIRQPSLADSHYLNFTSDASKMGYGGTFGSNWIEGYWPATWVDYHISLLEIYPIYILLATFAHRIQNSRIVFYCDNSGVVDILNKQTSKHKLIMHVVRAIVLTQLKFNVNIVLRHIPGKHNVLSDAISRKQVTPQLLCLYGMQPQPVKVAHHLLPENFNLF